MPIPFFEPFEEYTFPSKARLYNRLLVSKDDFDLSTDCPDEQRVIDAKGYSWDTFSFDSINKALKLTARNTNHPCLADFPKDRTELTYNLPTMNNRPIFIQWDLFVPNNDQFIDEEVEGPRQHIIFQLKTNHYNPEENFKAYENRYSTPMLVMEYLDRNDSLDLCRDLKVLMQSPNLLHHTDKHSPAAIQKSRKLLRQRMTIQNGIKKGEWNQILFKFYLSRKDLETDSIMKDQSIEDEAGYYQIWINGKPVVVDLEDPKTNLKWRTYYSNLAIVYEAPTKIYSANIFSDDSSQPLPTGIPQATNLHFGLYRSGYTKVQTMYIDNIKVTKSYSPTDLATELTLDYCDRAVNVSNQIIECIPVFGATNYSYEFENNGVCNVVNSNTNSIVLLDYSFLSPATKYNVRVKTKGVLNGREFDHHYGDICSITTPFQTKLRSKDFNNLGSQEFNGKIGCLKILKANKYVFRFRRHGEPIIYGTSKNTFIEPSSIKGLKMNKKYTVDVKAIRTNNEAFNFDFGESCNITFVEPSE